MENQPKDSEKDIIPHALRKPSKRARRWTLLFVADYGEIISFGHFKGLAVALASVLVAAVAAAVWFFFLYTNTKEESYHLKNDLAVLRQHATALRDEKDMLMARLVMAESKMKKAYTQEKKIEKSSDQMPAKGESAKPKSSASQAAFVAGEPNKTKTMPGGANRVKDSQRITAENFYVFHEPDTSTLKVRFFMRNTAKDADRISGHIIVILKPIEHDRNKWLVIPSVPLVSGKPSGENRGLSFSISRYKNVRLKAKGITVPNRFKRATVFVFATTGGLLLEKDFPVKLKKTLKS